MVETLPVPHPTRPGVFGVLIPRALTIPCDCGGPHPHPARVVHAGGRVLTGEGSPEFAQWYGRRQRVAPNIEAFLARHEFDVTRPWEAMILQSGAWAIFYDPADAPRRS